MMMANREELERELGRIDDPNAPARSRGPIERIASFDSAVARNLFAVEMPVGLQDRVLSAVRDVNGKRQKIAERSKRRRRLYLASVTAVAALVVLSVFNPFLPRSLSVQNVRQDALKVFERSAGDDNLFSSTDLASEMNWPEGFDARFYTGSANVPVVGRSIRAHRFVRNQQVLLVLMTRRSAYVTNPAGYCSTDEMGVTVKFLDLGDQVAVAVLRGAENDISLFQEQKSITHLENTPSMLASLIALSVLAR